MNQVSSKVRLNDSWLCLLGNELEKPYMVKLLEFLLSEEQKGKIIYPPRHEIFAAMNSLLVCKVRVVIVGQDPYHGEGQAHGLSFSVRSGNRVPPSLANILKEVDSDVGLRGTEINKGDLSGWAKQGVLLLNSILTVEHAKAGSHQGKGWEIFTDRLVERLSEARGGLIFFLWGAFAQKKKQFIDHKKHLVLTASHPSPLSARRGFSGCHHFSRANKHLSDKGLERINWAILR